MHLVQFFLFFMCNKCSLPSIFKFNSIFCCSKFRLCKSVIYFDNLIYCLNTYTTHSGDRWFWWLSQLKSCLNRIVLFIFDGIRFSCWFFLFLVSFSNCRIIFFPIYLLQNKQKERAKWKSMLLFFLHKTYIFKVYLFNLKSRTKQIHIIIAKVHSNVVLCYLKWDFLKFQSQCARGKVHESYFVNIIR